jgi:hypothetical protein
MQLDWLTAIPALFGSGFVVGYVVRALISRRRRRRARWSGRNASELQAMWLEPPPARTISSASDALRTADAPSILALDTELGPKRTANNTSSRVN